MIPKGLTPKKIAQEFILDAIDSRSSSSEPYWFVENDNKFTDLELSKISEQTDKIVNRLRKQFNLIGDGKGGKMFERKNRKPFCECD